MSRKIFALRTAGSPLTLKSRRQYYVSVIQPDLEYGSTAFSSSLSAREKARFFRARQVGKESAPSLEPRPGLQQRRFWRFLDLHHCQCVLTWSCCSSHIDVCTLLPAPFFVASTNWEPKQTACTAQHVVKHLTLSVFLQLLDRRSGELTPLYTSTLLYNNLPSELRSRSDHLTFPFLLLRFPKKQKNKTKKATTGKWLSTWNCIWCKVMRHFGGCPYQWCVIGRRCCSHFLILRWGTLADFDWTIGRMHSQDSKSLLALNFSKEWSCHVAAIRLMSSYRWHSTESHTKRKKTHLLVCVAWITGLVVTDDNERPPTRLRTACDRRLAPMQPLPETHQVCTTAHTGDDAQYLLCAWARLQCVTVLFNRSANSRLPTFRRKWQRASSSPQPLRRSQHPVKEVCFDVRS